MPKCQLTVLIFNDSLDVITTLERWFQAKGHSAQWAQLSIARSAHDVPRQMVERYKPHVIIYDVGIPYRPNWDFLESLRQSPAFQGIPIVVTTGNKNVLESLVGESHAIEMHGLQDDLDCILRAAETAAYAES